MNGGRFTARAQKVILMAQEEARELKHPVVGTEHVLLGLLREGTGVAAKALTELGLNLDDVRREVEQLVGRGDSEPGHAIAITPRVKKVLELAMDEALSLGQNYIGTEHLLLALIREGEGVASQVLTRMGVNLENARQQVIKLLGDMARNAPDNPKQRQSNTPTLDQMGRDLTALAKDGKLDPVIGREQEIERVVQILSRRKKNNPVLVGDPGVGKTAIAEGLAQRIADGSVPEPLRDKRVVTLDLSAVVAGTKYRGEFEQRLKKVMNEIAGANNIIIFIDELHTIVGAGAAEGAIDASNILKPALASGELQCIGATTLDEYRRYIEKDAALERRFQPVTVEEPTTEETIKILEGLRDKYEAHHRVKISDEAIQAAVRLSDRYITDRFLPDKAIDLIDEAASRVRLRTFTAPPDMKDLEDEIEEAKKEKDAAVANQEYEKAAELRDREQKLREKLTAEREAWKAKQQRDDSVVVNEEDIATIVATWTGIPVSRLAQEEAERLLKLEEILHNRVVGQEEAVSSLARAVRRARAGFKDPKRPIGSFIFLGPTGVGKTELARALAEALFGDEDAMIRIDMSEYQERHTVARLFGAPPGYVGYEEGGQLTEKVRRRPYSVVLFDEIEKAHPEVFNALLQIMEDGRLTDAKGRRVNFQNTVVIMTSNVGAETYTSGPIGFRKREDVKDNYEEMKERVMDHLKRTFRPEFLNRIDDIIVFHQLGEGEIKQIVDLMLAELDKRIKDMGLSVTVSDAAKGYLAKEGFDPQFGARPLRRTITRKIEDELSDRFLTGEFKAGDKITIDEQDGKLKFTKVG